MSRETMSRETMRQERDWVEKQFAHHQPYLRAVAYRMLGSLADADDAVQDAWIKVSGADTDAVENMRAWLTTVVSRVCLSRLRQRTARREDPVDVFVPDPIISPDSGADPEHEAVMADSVGLAMLVVLEQLTPPERLAFVLHDMFAVPFGEIAELMDRTPGAARQLASRARRRVRGSARAPDPDVTRQREVVDAFFAAARDGDFERLVATLHPDAVLRSDGGTARPALNRVLRGPRAIAEGAKGAAKLSPFVIPVLVNGAAGVVVAPRNQPQVVMGFTVVDGRILAIDVLADPHRIKRLDLSAVGFPRRADGSEWNPA